MLSKFVSALGKSYSSNRVLLKLIKEWKKSLDGKSFIEAVLMDLFKSCLTVMLLIYLLQNLTLMAFLWIQ